MKINAGFTLIEVLIATLILATGLLSLGQLQVTGLGNNLSAYNRSQAIQLAYNMADRMRTNVSAIGTNVYTTIKPNDAKQQRACTAVSGTCSAAAMAQQDLFEWNSHLSAILPSGVGIITAAASTFTVTLTWDDNRDGFVNNKDPSFQIHFQL